MVSKSGDVKYPQRPQYFANRLIRLLQKSCAANEIGVEGCWLVTCVALVEDSKRYSGPVTFWNGQLLPISGLQSWGRLDRCRRRAVEAGWLQYVPGRNRQAATYWTTVPAEIESTFDDSPVDAIDHHNGDSTEVNLQNGAHNGDQLATQTKPTQRTKRGTFIPNPLPIPEELSSPKFETLWQEWQQHRQEIKKPLTPTSTKKQLNKLAKWGQARAIAALEHTIANGWQGIREPEKSAALADDDWPDVWQFVRSTYQPDLKNESDVAATLTPEQFAAVKSTGIARIANADRFDKQTPEAYRSARRTQR